MKVEDIKAQIDDERNDSGPTIQLMENYISTDLPKLQDELKQT